MKSRGGEVAFVLRPCTVTHAVAAAIRQQIQYYFSLPNLITDHYLRSIINASRGGWVKTSIFINFNHIQHIFYHNLGNQLTQGEKQVAIRRSCQGSSLLELSNQAIRRVSHITEVKDFSNLLYFEGFQLDFLLKVFKDMDINQTIINMSKGSSWVFVEFKDKNRGEINYLYQQLMQRVQMIQNGKILLADEFLTFQKRYTQLIGITPLQTTNQYSQAIYLIPPNRVLSYRQVNELQQPRKKKPIRPKGKKNRTGLPHHLIYANFDKKKYEEPNRKALIHVQGCEPRQSKKTKEEVIEYRRMKIDARRKRKAARMIQSKREPLTLNEGMLGEGINSQL